MDNLEGECEDLVDELSVIRQRFPVYCTRKLSKNLRLTSEINITNVKGNSIQIDKIDGPLKLEEQKTEIFENFMSNLSNQHRNSKRTVENMLETINGLIQVTQQMKTEDKSSFKKCLKKVTRNINQT